jgi:hypothetical protein
VQAYCVPGVQPTTSVGGDAQLITVAVASTVVTSTLKLDRRRVMNIAAPSEAQADTGPSSPLEITAGRKPVAVAGVSGSRSATRPLPP